MHQESHSIDVGKNPLRPARTKIITLGCVRTLMMLCDQLPHLLAVKFWPAVTKLFFKGIAQRFHVPVFAKYQRDYQPVIARADPPIRTMVTVESARRPGRDVGR